MNTFLISVGAAIITALMMAFVAPVFVDWNGYRDRIEDQAQRILCRDVNIAGDLVVRLLPEPVITTGHIEVAGRGDQVLMSAAGSKLTFGLGGLLLGKIEVVALELDRPVFSLSTDDEGVLNWAAATARGCEPELARINVRRIGITNGIATFMAPSMAGPGVADKIDATLNAGGPAGPYKFTGAHGPAEARRGFRFSSGRITPGAPTRVSGRMALDDRTEVSFDGVAEGWRTPPRFTGVVKAERNLPGSNGEALQLKAEAQAEIDLETSEFSKLLLTATEDGTAATASGSARIRFGAGAPDILVDLKARRIDLGALFGGEGENPNGFAALLAQAGGWAEEARITGRISMSVDGALYRGELVRNVSASFNLGSQSLGIETLKAVLPGQSEFDFSGNLLRGAAGDKLLGTVVLNTNDLKRLLAWAVPPGQARFARLLPQTRGRLSFTGGLRAEAGAIELTGIEGLVDGKSFSGDMSFDLGEPGEVHAALAFDELDLDRMLPQDFAPLALLAGRNAAPGQKAPDIGLEIKARRVNWRGREARGLAAAGGFSDGALVVERFQLERFASGRLNAQGEVRFGDEGPRGGIDIDFETSDFPALPRIFGLDISRATGQGVSWLSKIRAGKFNGRLEAGKKDEAWRVGLTVDGTLGGTEISASLASDGAPANAASGRIEGAIKLTNTDAGRLFAQLGLKSLPETTPNAPGELTFDLVGSIDNGFGYGARFTGFDATATAEGNIETSPARIRGRLSLNAADSNRIADLLGLGTHAPVLPETDLAMDFDLKGGALDVALVKGRIAGVGASGRGRVQIAGRRSGTFNLDLERLSLPWALASLFGGGAEVAAVLPGLPSRWSSELIDASALNRWPVALNIGAGRLTLAGDLVLEDGTIEANVGEGRLELTKLAGTLVSGGGFEASGDIVVSELALGVEGKIKADGLPIGRYLADGDGRPLLDGRAGVDLTFKAAGRSLLSLVSSLSGEGAVTFDAAAMPRLNATRLLKQVGRAGNAAAIEAMVSGAQDGATPLTIEKAKVSANNGRIKVGPAKVEAGRAAGQVTSFINLVGGRVDQEISLSSGQAPRLAVIHAGGFGAISRQIEILGLATGAVRWREPSSGAGPPGGSEPRPDDAGNTAPGPAADAPADLANTIPPPNSGGPPVGVIEERVFELPLAGGG